MKARRVATVHALGHVLQVGFQLRQDGPWSWPSNSRPLWKVAYFVEDHAPVQQCWSDLVSWVFGSGWDDRTLRSVMPWRPVTQTCRDDAARVGACYCGKVATAECAAGPNGPRASVIVPAEVLL